MSASDRPGPAEVYLGLGSNLGDRAANLWTAIAHISRIPGCHLERLSPIYESDPVGPVPQGAFLNAVAALRVRLLPLDLLKTCQQIERTMGRRPSVRWGPRLIDLDLLLFGATELESAELVLPHPEMWGRRFVLLPLLDVVASDRLRRRVRNHLYRLGTAQVVHRYDSTMDGATATAGPPLRTGQQSAEAGSA